jgi:beta-glucosidase
MSLMKTYIQKAILFLLFLLPIVSNTIVKKWDPALLDLITQLDEKAFIETLQLPELFGSAVSEYQVSGASHLPASQWAAWEIKDIHNGKLTIHNHDRSENACDFWNTYPEDIALMDECGFNTFRFSVDWAAIEPEEGIFDQDAFDHYIDLVRELKDHEITPMITLDHFSHPQWFEEKGGFAKRKNIKHFVRFCKKVFKKLSADVKLWCTINEIGPFVFQGYIQGVFPPGKNSLPEAFMVMANMLEAHARVYHTLKTKPHGNDCQIGLVHQYLTFEAYDQSWLGLANPLEQAPIRFMNYIFNDAMLYALKHDTIFPYIPGLRRTIKGLSKSYDFIGLNFYSRVVIRSQMYDTIAKYFNDKTVIAPAFATHRENEIMTDMDYPICPESFYEAIMEINKLNVPIYITENGCPDDRDDRRELYIKTYLFALSQAIKDGANVKGYYYWSFMDNFEWNEGWEKKFGLYEVDLRTKERTLRKGAELLKNIALYKKATDKFEKERRYHHFHDPISLEEKAVKYLGEERALKYFAKQAEELRQYNNSNIFECD